MEDLGDATPHGGTGFGASVKRWLAVSAMMLWGGGVAALFGGILLAERAPQSPWRIVLLSIGWLWMAWQLLRQGKDLLIEGRELAEGRTRPLPSPTLLAIIACGVLVFVMRGRD